jgi:UDP-glucose 4-epimerase
LQSVLRNVRKVLDVSLHLITGGAGFVGVNLIRELIRRGDSVVSVDNYCRGSRAFLSEFEASGRLTVIDLDCSVFDPFLHAVSTVHTKRPIEHGWHLAANSDIPAGVSDPHIDLRDTFMTTFTTLLVMRALKIPQLHFASSSAIYGDAGDVEIHEDRGPLEPISNYGAMKLASEAQVRAAVEAFLPRANIFRFPNVVGVPATHGVILDFVQRLKSMPQKLEVLGNGTQQKLYLHVSDLVSAMLHISGSKLGRYNVYNIGPQDEGVTVRQIAMAVRDRVSPGAEVAFGTEGRGWVGDVPKFRYSTQRLKSIGWSPSLSSLGAIERAVSEIALQEGK